MKPENHSGGTSIAGLFFVLMLLLIQSAPAQTVTLNPAQQQRLLALANTHKDGKLLVKIVLRDADLALAEQPHPVAEIQSAGLLNSDADKKQTVAALEDMPRMEDLAWAMTMTGKQAYADHLRDYVLAWAAKMTPPPNPIDATKLAPLIMAYDLLRPRLTAVDRRKVDAWLQACAVRLIDEGKPNKDGTIYTNFHSHRLKIVGLVGFVTGDKKLVQYAIDGFKQQVVHNLNPDGSSYDFHERDALHYHVYTLEPLLALAIAADKNGDCNLYDYQASNKASLRKSVEFLLPYLQGQKTYAEYVNSKVEFDRKRADAGQKGFEIGGAFDPAGARNRLGLASYFDPRLRGLVAQLAEKSDREYPTWQTLLNAAAGH
ncbi:MAG TPA: alginate lyase family protein [Pirellulales bacterium]|jgi:hypothetical protein|nr:alginate lyase family protein [Pirellulales bacterium]